MSFSSRTEPGADAAAPPVDHYENFPVASWLCPPALRPSVGALYHFARTADDLADEGPASPAQRLLDLGNYRAQLLTCFEGAEGPPAAESDPRWAWIFGPLRQTIARHTLPPTDLLDLLSAFEQDVVRTRDRQGYTNRAELQDYCRRSANPVGRLMLHLFGVQGEEALRESDAVCTALQLINFWQDLSVDLPRGRHYLPEADVRAFGLAPDQLRVTSPQDLAALAARGGAAALVASLCTWAREEMRRGAGIVHRVPGRAGWELRAVVQGGLRTLERVESLGAAAFVRRPSLGAADWLVIAWRCLAMRKPM